MDQRVDIKENLLDKLNQKILKILLKDKTTQKNIIWATSDYEYLGEEYASNMQIIPSAITGFFGDVIRPRVEKNKTEQNARIKNKAEVFTPSWICNMQNNLIDNAWLENVSAFNIETANGWIATTEKITFPEGKTWQEYVQLKRLEISCGEAPYLVSRYDAVTGEPIPVEQRIGLLDRKLRIVCENCNSEPEWVEWAIKAVQSVYGFDWQGDNVLIARENILFTFADYYAYKFTVPAIPEYLMQIAKIVVWNIWQMDGINFVIPNSCHDTIETQTSLLGETTIRHQCPGCKSNNHSLHNGIYAKTYDWTHQHSLVFYSTVDSAFRRKS